MSSPAPATADDPLSVVRSFVDACASHPALATRLLHPEIPYRALIANGAVIEHRDRGALVGEWRDFLVAYGKPEILDNVIEPVGHLIRWSARWRVTRDGERSVFEWHGFLTVTDGLITRFDEVCTGRLPAA